MLSVGDAVRARAHTKDNRPGVVLGAYQRGSRTDVGAVVEAGSLLAVDVPPGHHRVHVRYRPPCMTFGIVVSAVTTLLVAGLFVRGAPGRCRGADTPRRRIPYFGTRTTPDFSPPKYTASSSIATTSGPT
jgi:hypothetical protein